MKYIVVEIQTNPNGAIGNLVTAYDDRQQAESHYHLVLSAAAVSALPAHAAVLLTSYGVQLASACYYHEVDAE